MILTGAILPILLAAMPLPQQQTQTPGDQAPVARRVAATAQLAAQEYRVGVVNGRVDVAIASRAAGDMEFSSGNGSITVTLPSSFSAQIEASTGNGGFQSDFPLQVNGRISSHRVSGTIGSGGGRMRLSTGNGSITLRRAGS